MNKIVVAVTGASGSIYAQSILDKLLTIKEQWQNLSIVITENARNVWKTELQNEAYLHYPVQYYNQQDFMAPFASVSYTHLTLPTNREV